MIVVGSEYGLRTEYFRPLFVNSNWFVAPQVLFDSNAFNGYNSSGDLTSIYRAKQAGGGVDVGYDLARSQEFRVGYVTEHLSYSLQVAKTPSPQCRDERDLRASSTHCCIQTIQ